MHNNTVSELSRYQLEKLSDGFVDRYLKNQYQLKATYYSKIHDAYFDKAKGDYEHYLQSVLAQLKPVEDAYVCSDRPVYNPELDPDNGFILIQRFYNQTDLFITLIATQFQHPDTSVFIAVDDWFDEFSILKQHGDNLNRPRIQLNLSEKHKDFKKFKVALEKYCGSDKKEGLEKYGRVYMHRLINSIVESCVGKEVHHCDSRSINNHPSNLKAFDAEKHTDIHLILNNQQQEKKDLFFKKLKNFNRGDILRLITPEMLEVERNISKNSKYIYDDFTAFKVLYLKHIIGLTIDEILSRFRGNNRPSKSTISTILNEYKYFQEYLSAYPLKEGLKL